VLDLLLKLSEVLVKAAKRITDYRKNVSEERQQLALLTMQFCFAGLAKTGKQLLELAGTEPSRKLERMSAEDLRTFHAITQRHISIQLERLQKLHQILNDQLVLDLFDFSLRSEIEALIGDKEQGLYSIGAGLLFYLMLLRPPPGSRKPEDLKRTADIICAQYPEIEEGVIAVEQAARTLEAMNEVNDRYREILNRIIPATVALRLSNDASRLAAVD
jgi:hypothetical protein